MALTRPPVSQLSWSPSAPLVVLGWVAAAAAVVWCVLLTVSGSDPAGRLIAGIAAVMLIVASLFGTVARPRLRVDDSGLTVTGLRGSRHHPWPFVRDVRVLRGRRLGLSTSLLEIDTCTLDGDEQLVVLGRLDLAEDPEEVAAAVLRRRPHSP